MADNAPWLDFQKATDAPTETHSGPWLDFQKPAGEASTTAPGIAASLARGAAPYAAGALAGALAGAAAGAPIGGVGAIPGAMAGAGAVGLTDLAGAVYNPVAQRTGLPQLPSSHDLTDKMMDWAGINRPSTGIERAAETASAGAAGGFTGAGAMGQLAGAASNPVVRGAAEALGQGPGLQAASGAASGVAAQGAAEAGMGKPAQQMIGFLGSFTPYGKQIAQSLYRINPSQAATAAIDRGFVLPPAEATEGKIAGNTPPDLLASASGKIKTAQYASSRNQLVTNELAASDLGLPPATKLTPEVFKDVKERGGQHYETLKSVPEFVADAAFRSDVQHMALEARMAAQEFPGIVDVAKVEAMRDTLLSKTQMSGSATIEAIKQLRFDAASNLKNTIDPEKMKSGLAQRAAANILEDLVERNLQQTGQTQLLEDFRAGRTLIAKASDYEAATNVATGDVDARHIGALLDKGKPLSGNARVIAEAALNFPKAFQPASKIGGVERYSVLDIAYGIASHAAAAALLRPVARSIVLSPASQRNMVNPPPMPTPMVGLTQPGILSALQPPPPPWRDRPRISQ